MEKRVALVTGSASGLGVRTVLDLAQQGHHIVINYRNSHTKALTLKQEVEKLGVSCFEIKGDITQRSDCHFLVQQVIEQFGRIDILVNNAGPYVFERKKMVDYEDDEWEMMINGNLNSVFYLCKSAIPHMRKQRWGRIITIGFNQAAQATGWKYRSAFAASKVGLVSLTKTLAEEESKYGITVNMVCPGDIVGENKEKCIREVREQEDDFIAPIGRAGAGEDVGRVISFLCAEDSDFITGSIMEINGGFNVIGKRISLEMDDKPEG